jgi:predicted SAM-dependent methyltransferase
MAGDGWVNVDVNPEAPGVHVIADIGLEGWPFAEESVDAVKAFDVLEHFSYHKASYVLEQWIKALRPGGTITIRVPDLDAICEAFLERRLPLLRTIQVLYGGQTNQWDYHKIAINFSWVSGQLHWWGCTDVVKLPDERQALRVQGRKREASRGWVRRNLTRLS